MKHQNALRNICNNMLLDTCAFIWFLEDSPKLSHEAKAIIEDGEMVYLSIVSLWEIAIKKNLGKLEIKQTMAELAQICWETDIIILPIKTSYLDKLEVLPGIHGDPFDRLIISTAMKEGSPIVTHDANIVRYNIPVIW